MKVEKDSSGSFIVDFWSRVFGALRHVALFPFVMKAWQKILTKTSVSDARRKRLTFLLVDCWTLGHLLLAVLGLWLLNLNNPAFNTAGLWVSTYGLLRTFELVIYQVNILLFDEYRAKKSGKEYQIRGYRRMVMSYCQIWCSRH